MSQQQKIEKWFQEAVTWIRTHREQFWAIVGTVAGGTLLIVFMVNRRQTENAEAWTQLGVTQGYLIQKQNDLARKSLDQWNTRFKGTSAEAYAKFLEGDLLYNTSDYAGAARVYTEISQTARPDEVRPLALAAASSSQEMAGRLPEALALAQQFIEKYPDHFLAASVMISQGRISEITGNKPQAASTYDRFVVLYPQSPWTAFARARLQVLGQPAATVPTPK